MSHDGLDGWRVRDSRTRRRGADPGGRRAIRRGVRRVGVAARAARSKVVVGRDSRVSGPMFHRVVLSALQSVGCDVIDIGLTTTPTCQLAVEHHHAAGGLMISASHNPIEWNALKFIGPTGLFLENAEGIAMRAPGRARHSARDVGRARPDRGRRPCGSATHRSCPCDTVRRRRGDSRSPISRRARLRSRRRRRHHAARCSSGWAAA